MSAQVEGDIEEVNDVLRITTIRIHYRLAADGDVKEKANRALEVYSAGCPAYQSVKECIKCTWDLEIVPLDR